MKDDKKEQGGEIDLQLIIDYINSQTDYHVIPKTELQSLKSSSSQKAKTSDKSGDESEKPPPRPPLPSPKKQDAYLFPYQQYGPRPNLPQFSGENRSGEVTFDVWKYDVRCLVHDEAYPLYAIRQSIRNSLRGKARSILVSMGEDVTPESIVQKMESIFGNVRDKEALLETFYKQSQTSDESVAEYGMRLENLLQIPVERGLLSSDERNTMLCSKFFFGLKDPLLQSSIRFKYESTKDFDTLLREARAVELQLQTTSTTPASHTDTKASNKQQSASHTSLDDIAKKLEALTSTVHHLQTQMNQVKGDRDNQRSPAYQPPDAYGNDDYYGYYRGGSGYRGYGGRGRSNDRGRGFNRGRGSAQPLNLRKSPSRGTRR